MSMRETAMSALKTVLDGIISIKSPVPDSGNSGSPADLIVQSGGTFSGTSLYQYAVSVTTGGVSAVAKISYTGTESGGPLTVVSGTPISIGTKGVTLTMIFTGSLIVGDKWSVSADVFNNTVKEVVRAHQVGVQIKDFPAIILAEGRQEYGETNGGKYDVSMDVDLEGWMREREAMATELNAFVDDIEAVIGADVTLSNTVFDTQFVNLETGLPEKDRPFGVAAITLRILFKQVIG